jgi:hypothetical protein
MPQARKPADFLAAQAFEGKVVRLLDWPQSPKVGVFLCLPFYASPLPVVSALEGWKGLCSPLTPWVSVRRDMSSGSYLSGVFSCFSARVLPKPQPALHRPNCLPLKCEASALGSNKWCAKNVHVCHGR